MLSWRSWCSCTANEASTPYPLWSATACIALQPYLKHHLLRGHIFTAKFVDPHPSRTKKQPKEYVRAHLKGVNRKGGLRICLPVHCLSAWSDRQPYCHTNATSSPCWRTTKLRTTIACQYTVGTSSRGDIVLRSRSPRKCHYPLFAYPLFERAQYVLGPDIRRTSTRTSRRFRGQKLWSNPRNPGKKQAFRWGRSMTRRCGCPWPPQAVQNKFGQNNFGLNFLSLILIPYMCENGTICPFGVLQRKFLWVRRGCQASQRKGLTSGEVRELPGKNFRGSPGNFRGTPGLLFSSTVRELPGESPKNFRGSSGNFRGSRGTSQKLGGAWLPCSDSPNLSPSFSPNFIVFLVSTLDICPSKRSVFGV